MSFIQPKFNLSNLDFSLNKIDKQLSDKKSKELLLKSGNKTYARSKLIYDSDWIVNEIEDINGAVSTIYEELLPQKIPYDFSFDLQIPEELLPFLRYDIIAKTTPTQDVRGVGVFNFSSLREVSLQLYDWAGNTQISGGYIGTTAYYTEPFYPPTLPIPTEANTGAHFPKPDSAYEPGAEYNYVRVNNVGTGLGPFLCRGDGSSTEVRVTVIPEQWVDFYDWTVSLFVTYYPFANFNITLQSAYTVTFEPPIYDFPIPISSNVTYSFPQGTTDDESNCDEYYLSQYYVADEIVDFDTYVTMVGYDEASTVFTTYYPNVIITAEGDGPPYKAFENTTVETIKTCNQQIIIDKVTDDNFRFRIKGYLLLISPAIIETDYSDPTLPTYQPQGEDMFIRLKVYYDSQLIQKKNIRYGFK